MNVSLLITSMCKSRRLRILLLVSLHRIQLDSQAVIISFPLLTVKIKSVSPGRTSEPASGSCFIIVPFGSSEKLHLL